tara:strand:+ start:3253 stop:3819 length:567 start_codon:yes stop_codon:yes gene_type:complete
MNRSLLKYLIKGPLFALLTIVGLVALTQYDCDTLSYQSERQKMLEQAIKEQIMVEHPDIRYIVKWFDLNADGIKEAIVHVMGPELCNQDACHNYIFHWDLQKNHYKQVGQHKRANPPILATPDKGKGWYSLRMALDEDDFIEYKFNGKRYMKNKQVKIDLIHHDTPYGAQLLSPSSVSQSVALFRDLD